MLRSLTILTIFLGGCYSSDDLIGGGDAGFPDSVPDLVDPPPDSIPPDTWVDTGPDVGPPPDSWPDLPPDVFPDPDDPPWPDIPPDVVDVIDVDLVDAPPAGVVGDACTRRSDCAGVPSSSAGCWTSVMGILTFPGGYCSASCSTDGECGTGAVCVDFILETMCLKTCVDASECRVSDGYDCMDLPWVGGGPYCLPGG